MFVSIVAVFALLDLAFSAPPAQATYCAEDNLLRAFQHTPTPASKYCSTGTGYPTFLAVATYPATRIASACSCFARFPAEGIQTTTTTTSSCPSESSLCGGACVMLSTDTSNCGHCGTVCQPAANSSPSCLSGTCSFNCNAGFGNCNQNPIDGCEVNLNNDVNNCGNCGKVCAAPNSSPTCSSGNCAYNCNAGFGDCNQTPIDGCEVNLTNDINNCGNCGRVCAAANSSPTCSSGNCAYNCNAGFGDCNQNLIDGCEVNLTNDIGNCGACGHACPVGINGVTQCTNSVCTITCSTGFMDCDGNLYNGCEVNTNNDVGNCGGCGKACPSVINADTVCQSGTCAYLCKLGFKDCDGYPGNGCETSVLNNPQHCGSCDNVCTGSCEGGACDSSTA